MRQAWLTIDDSPSPETDRLTDLLVASGIPALLFVRGDRLAEDDAPVIRAIQRGLVVGSHAYSHQRCSRLGFDAMTNEIARTESLIDRAYRAAGVARPAKYFRFPHMDRGAGGWIVDFDASGPYRQTLIDLFAGGLNIDLTPPSAELRDLKARLQDWLRTQGYVAPDWSKVTYPWFRATEMAAAVDAMFTFSTSDWMVTPRHADKWPYKTPGDLIAKIDNDPWLNDDGSADIILMHDQADMLGITAPLLKHMQKTIEFLPF